MIKIIEYTKILITLLFISSLLITLNTCDLLNKDEDDNSGLIGLLGLAAAGATPTCRTYGTSVTGSDSNSYTVVFDSTAKTYTRTRASDSVQDIATYNSISDFVDEVSVVPLKSLHTQQVIGAVSYTCIPQYNSSTQMTGGNCNSGAIVVTYTAWDSNNRPTTGTRSNATPTCNNFSETWTYNDTTRVATVLYDYSSGSGGGCPGSPSLSTSYYDTNGNLIRQVSDLNNDGDTDDASESDVTYTINTTAQVCK